MLNIFFVLMQNATFEVSDKFDTSVFKERHYFLFRVSFFPNYRQENWGSWFIYTTQANVYAIVYLLTDKKENLSALSNLHSQSKAFQIQSCYILMCCINYHHIVNELDSH